VAALQGHERDRGDDGDRGHRDGQNDAKRSHVAISPRQRTDGHRGRTGPSFGPRLCRERISAISSIADNPTPRLWRRLRACPRDCRSLHGTSSPGGPRRKGAVMTSLTLAAVFLPFSHFGISSSRLRDLMVRGLGEQPYRGVYSLVTVVAFAWLIR